MKKKYHYFYKITNNINGHYYYGVHNTDNLNDGYIGSGTRLHYAYERYGIENFSKEILKFFNTEQEAFSYEEEIVTESLVKDDSCYNISLGGKYTNLIGKAVVKDANGNNFITDINDSRYVNGELSGVTRGKVIVKDVSGNYFMVAKNDERITRGVLKYIWTNRHHTEKTKKNMSLSHIQNKDQTGERNSQYGTCWITDGVKSKKVKKTDVEQYLKEGWKRGRVVTDEFRKKMSEIQRDYGYQKKEKNSQYNTKWVTKNGIEKKIKSVEIDKYLSDGYVLGRKKTPKEGIEKKN